MLLALNLAAAPTLSGAHSSAQTLSDSQRRSLRYHLENLYNEFDLLIRNQKVDAADLAKQGRTISALRIYERIPFSPQLATLKKQLTESAQEAQIRLLEFKLRKSATHPLMAMPRTLSRRDGFFRPKPQQLAQEIPFQIRVSGTPAQVESWTRSWKENLMRLVEVERLDRASSSQRGQYVIRAHAFQFKNVKFPKIIPPQAEDYLPQWAKANPDNFSQQEPTLWSFVTRSEKLRPLTPPLYEKRGQFFMEGGRIEFFLSKAGK
jgi:hypothetical protein